MLLDEVHQQFTRLVAGFSPVGSNKVPIPLGKGCICIKEHPLVLGCDVFGVQGTGVIPPLCHVVNRIWVLLARSGQAWGMQNNESIGCASELGFNQEPSWIGMLYCKYSFSKDHWSSSLVGGNWEGFVDP